MISVQDQRSKLAQGGNILFLMAQYDFHRYSAHKPPRRASANLLITNALLRGDAELRHHNWFLKVCDTLSQQSDNLSTVKVPPTSLLASHGHFGDYETIVEHCEASTSSKQRKKITTEEQAESETTHSSVTADCVNVLLSLTTLNRPTLDTLRSQDDCEAIVSTP